jgi:hypothetical protein
MPALSIVKNANGIAIGQTYPLAIIEPIATLQLGKSDW